MSRKTRNRETTTPPLTSEGDTVDRDAPATAPATSMTDVLMLMEEQRREDRERDRKFQDMMLHMLTTQTAQLELTREKETERREEERRLEQARLYEMEKQREQGEKRHLELLEVEKEKLQAETRRPDVSPNINSYGLKRGGFMHSSVIGIYTGI